VRLYLTALNPTDSVLDGFLPAAARLGLPVTILTDQPESWPAIDADIRRCEVRDTHSVITTVLRGRPPAALLSNSDHLQTPTALAADYLRLPGKDWRAALRCKDKWLTRQTLAAAGLDGVTSVCVGPTDDPAVAAAVPFPAVVKPRTGVASEDVYLVADRTDLQARVRQIRSRRPDIELVVEEYLFGELRTFETLGDGADLAYLGGWRTTLGSPPNFIEERLDWAPDPPQQTVIRLQAQLDALGVGFGPCHTEFVIQDDRPRLIEVNYRLIGDRMDLILAELLNIPLFDYVIRLHLGEPVSAMALPDPIAAIRHAQVEYVCADRSGTLVAAPGAMDVTDDGIRLSCRPMRQPGAAAERTGTNRDYLAVLYAIGPDQPTTATALKQFRASLAWDITG